MSIRKAFVKEFGEETAAAIEQAAEFHENGMHPDQGNDPFKWAILLAISYQCFEVDGYRKHHGIKPSYAKIKNWLIKNGHLDSYNGDFDYLAAAVGAYEPYMPKKKLAPNNQPSKGK